VNPISHALIGWCIAQPLEYRRDRILVTCAAIAPDLDGVSILAGLESYGKYHHTFGHNVFAALCTTVICRIFARSKMTTAVLGFVSFHSHILADMLGSGAAWPIPYFWPVSHKMFAFGPPFQWELDSWQNLAITAFAMIIVFSFAITKKRTIVETLSLRMDAELVRVLRKWAGRGN
jgi:membrane-bound metal-dependent hydrolase YbcI (DUF457 family)